MEKYFVLLGCNKLLRGQVCHLRELGYKVIVVAWNDNPDITGDIYIQLDVKDAKAIISRLEELGLKGKVGGALSSIDLAAPTVNAINGWCGNKTMPEKFNKVLTKEEMRDAWMKAGVFNRISRMDDEFPVNDLYETSQRMKLICKPNIAASSRGITILEKGQSLESLQEAMNKAKETSFDGRCLFEEFVEGEEFTVDMLGDAYGNVNCYSSSIQYHSLYALKNHVTVIHHWNSRKYDDETWVKIAEFGIACYKALGLHSMFGHLEIIMKDDGTFTPVEMGARSSGFICSHTVWKASGHDYLGDYVRMLHGNPIKPGNYMNGPNASMWFGYDIPSNSHSVCETDITHFLDPRITVLFENHDGLKNNMDFSDYINDSDRDKFGYAILSGPCDVLTYESVQSSNEQFLDKYLGRKLSNPISLVPYDRVFFDMSKKWLLDKELNYLQCAGPLPPDEDREAWFCSLNMRSDYLIWGISYNQTPIGVSGLKHITSEDAEYWGYIGDKKLWGRGLGKQILNETINIAKRIGLKRVRLIVLKSNLRAIKLYHNFGFIDNHEDESFCYMTKVI